MPDQNTAKKPKKMIDFLSNIEKYEKEAGVKSHGFYSNNSEHTSFMILEADDYIKVSKFLGIGPILTHHTARITPVASLEETLEYAGSIVKE